ncbi:MAG: rRNA methyltransferase [Rickettsiaceae bacterium]|jgi:23S rRNA (adenine2503-C2)-methyltransferase|nr:rRNA methyltransferase [Rickettsiaceae bacterium]
MIPESLNFTIHSQILLDKNDFKLPQFLPTANFKVGEKTNLIGLSLAELEQEMLKIDEKSFKAKQLWNWIYFAGANNFAAMSNISNLMKEKLEKHYSISKPAISQDLLSSDGTRKWLVKFSDCREAEMVFIPEEDRGTLCISSQIGCTLTCKFCHTGTQLLVRNLSAGEIVSQFMLARDLLDDWHHHRSKNNSSEPEKRKITSIVFMGMGEPFFNYDNVKKAVEILNDSNGLNFSKRRITISTSGVVPEIIRFSDEIKTVLAISLHATNDETRSKIMPLNKKYPLKELMQACQYYVAANPGGRITFEYVTLKDVNDKDEDARNLVKLLKTYKLPALINLIPFNPWQGSDFLCSSRNRIMAFGKIIKDAGYTVTIRKTRGQDVMAACGQLKSASQREKKQKQ